MNSKAKSSREELLGRIDAVMPLNTLVRSIAQEFGIGAITAIRPITKGYDDLNVLVVTDRGKYVVKIFNKVKDSTVIRDNVRVLAELADRGASVPRLVRSSEGYLYRAQGHSGTVYACVFQYFRGRDFTRCQPTPDDMDYVTFFLTQLHTLPYSVVRNYDSWGTANLVQEYRKKQSCITRQTADIIAAVATEFEGLDFTACRKTIVHGDLQRKHVLKGDDNTYCILDFGCMDYNYAVFDIGIYLALFCLDVTQPSRNQMIIDRVLQAYIKSIPLSDKDLAHVGTIIKATYAMYALSSEYLLGQGDASRQTQEWHRFALRGLETWL